MVPRFLRQQVWVVLSAFALACNPGRHPPAVHRSSPEVCSQDRAAFISAPSGGDAGSEAGAFISCKTDSDCTGGANGRCAYILYRDAGPGCNYDECFSDTDCPRRFAPDGGLTVCNCRGDPAHGGVDSLSTGPFPNYCMADGNCHQDSDCAGTGAPYCSPSPTGGCTNFWLGYFCHASADECMDDSDCASSPASICAWNGTKWACTPATSCLDGGA